MCSCAPRCAPERSPRCSGWKAASCSIVCCVGTPGLRATRRISCRICAMRSTTCTRRTGGSCTPTCAYATESPAFNFNYFEIAHQTVQRTRSRVSHAIRDVCTAQVENLMLESSTGELVELVDLDSAFRVPRFGAQRSSCRAPTRTRVARVPRAGGALGRPARGTQLRARRLGARLSRVSFVRSTLDFATGTNIPMHH